MPESANPVRTLEKGLRILDAVSQHGGDAGITLTELAEVTGISRSTLHRFLTTLRASRYLERLDGSDRYQIGLGVLRLAGALLDGHGLRGAASGELHTLMIKTSETCHLCLLDGTEVVFIDKVDSPNVLRMYSYVGLRLPAYTTAAGKAILAFAPEHQVRTVLAADLPRTTARTITTEVAFREHLVEVRNRGYAIDDEEQNEGIRCVAAPVFDFDRRVVAAISLSAPAGRLSLEQAHQSASLVREAAEAVSRRLGYRV